MGNKDKDIDLGFFIGSEDSYKEVKRQYNVEDDESQHDRPRRRKKDEEVEVNITTLATENLEPLDEATLKLLKRARCKHSCETVYMQSNLEFYDSFYNNDEVPSELMAARNIRRMYKKYTDYLDAMEVRVNYLDYLIDKYGGETEFMKKYDLGMIKDWIPPVPMLSKKCPDYALYVAGILPPEEHCKEGLLEETIKKMQEQTDLDNIVFSSDVETDIGIIRLYEEQMEADYGPMYSHHSSRPQSASVTDLNSLANVFKSWYEEDEDESTKFFWNSPENIRKRWEAERPYNYPGLLTAYMDGTAFEEDEEEDLNEMVFDDVTHRSMTRRELYLRQHVRAFAKGGWSESRLLNYMNVGSKIQKSFRSRKRSKKRGGYSEEGIKVPGDIFDGMEPSLEQPGLESAYVDHDYFLQSLNNLMAGE